MIEEIGHFTPYTPTNPIVGVRYLKDILENDWYDVQKNYSIEPGINYVSVSSDGIVQSASEDHTMLFPEEMTVYRTDMSAEIGMALNNGLFGHSVPDPTANDVRAECERRVLEVYPQYEQNNDNETRMDLLEIKVVTNLTVEQQATWDAIEARRQAKDDLRFCSNQMEGSPPTNYQDDSKWIKANWTA